MRHAFKLAIRPGTDLEYERRHRAVYPELLQVFREADVKTYSLNLPALKDGDSRGTTMAASRVVRPWE